MLHLFNKTYLEIDSFIDQNVDRIVISNLTGIPLSSHTERFFIGNLFAYGTSFEETVGEGKAFENFIQMLNTCNDHNVATNKKVIIYCDKETLMKITSLWFKLIFKNPQSATCYNIIKSWFNKESYMTNAGYLRATDEGNYIAFDINEPEFTQTFNTTTLSDEGQTVFFDKVKEMLSLEYYIASYYHDGSKKDSLKNIVKLMIKRHIRDMTKDVWRIIVKHIGSSKFQQVMNVSLNYTVSNYIQALDDIRFNSLRLIGANQSSYDDWSSIHTLPNFSNLSDPQIEEIKEQILKVYAIALHGLTYTDFDSFSSMMKNRNNLFFKIAKSNNITDEELTQVVGSSFLVNDLEKFWSSIDLKNINVYLLAHFVELKEANQQALLTGYVLK